MRWEEARRGMRVRVRETHRKLELRGLLGTVQQRWGSPNYRIALLVWLDEERYELFWSYELEEAGQKLPTGRYEGAVGGSRSHLPAR